MRGFLILLNLSYPLFVFLHVDPFQHLRQDGVYHHQSGEPEAEGRDHDGQVEEVRDRGEADQQGHEDDSEGRDGELLGGAVLEEGHLRRADRVDDEGLRDDAEHEPAVLEEAGLGDVIELEDVPENQEAQDVEDGTEQSEDDHELLDARDVPLFGFLDAFVFDVVEGHAELGEIVEDVLHQDVDGQQGQKGEENARDQDREHVSEVAADGHLQVFGHIGKCTAAFDDTFIQDVEVLLEENDVRDFLRDVHGGVDGDADVGLLQRQAIVDAVAHVADGVAIGLEGLNDALLLVR